MGVDGYSLLDVWRITVYTAVSMFVNESGETCCPKLIGFHK